MVLKDCLVAEARHINHIIWSRKDMDDLDATAHIWHDLIDEEK